MGQLIRDWVASTPGIKLTQLLQPATAVGRDIIYTLIATQQLYVDLKTQPLAAPEQVTVFLDAISAERYGLSPAANRDSVERAPRSIYLEVNTTVLWDNRPWTIVNVGETQTALLGAEGLLITLPNSLLTDLVHQGQLTGVTAPDPVGLDPAARDLLAAARPEDLQEANRRYQLLRPVLTGEVPTAAPVPARTLRAWKAQYQQAEQRYSCGYVGLLPQHAQKGNRQAKLSEATRALQEQFIAEHYETLKQKSARSVYGALVKAGEEQGIAVPSYKTFVQAIHARPHHEQLQKRQGTRAAYSQEPCYWELPLTVPRHGERPFEIGHIDHTELDIELICSQTQRNLGRPWATFLVDAFSRRLLAVYLTFDPPSYRSCMMVVRECVRRHHRLPQTLITDGGLEFSSLYFESLLARYMCVQKTRPAGKPRFGSVCERLFGTSNTQFIHNLAGNTQVMTAVRQVTASVLPQNHAVWTLSTLHTYLCTWAYEVYDTLEHPALKQSPRAAFAQGLAQGGLRAQRLIPYDQDFIMATLPSTPKGTAKVQPNHGLKLHYLYYWSDTFRQREVENTQVPVRYDPFDVGVVYAFVQGRWVQCISEHYSYFSGRSEREMKLATTELRQQQRRHTQHSLITARQLADFIASAEAAEVLLTQRLRDAENRQITQGESELTPATPKPEKTTSAVGLPPTPRPPAPPETPTTPPPTSLKLYTEY